nr:immunoglobulin heavy chain junction region [Mus musculus]MBK4190050.1 immunoglobulin heavy chain junction region [Mus musculus]MBK4190051.1 immunoglobulin heavy chain junction region [Mus musculus]MBK4196281.1 immunoglobulin heavy chain junction region [Mus musculus]
CARDDYDYDKTFDYW